MLLRSALSSKRFFSAAAAKNALAAASSSLLHTPATEVTALGNGLRVASESSHGEVATVGVWIDGKPTKKNLIVFCFQELTSPPKTKRYI